MRPELNVVDLDNELRIIAVRRWSLAEAAVSTSASGGFVALLASQYLERLAVVVLALGASFLAFVLARRKRAVELRVARDQFVVRGRVGDEVRPRRRVSVSGIQWLEYQDDTTGPESSHHPGGLYAVLEHQSICLLPDVDETQTAMVVERIESKFPELRRRWRGASSFGRHFTSMKLSEGKPSEP